MHKSIFPLFACLLASLSAAAQITDDFSQKDWTLFSSTPGTIVLEPGKMKLTVAEEGPSWVTANKTYTVNVDETPVFMVMVGELSNQGTVKLIRQTPYDKRVAPFNIDRPGLYAVNMKKKFGWKGECEINACLYALGDEEEISYSYVKIAAALNAEETVLLKQRKTGKNPNLDILDFQLVPSFNACSLYFPTPELEELSVLFREQGKSWQKAFAPVYIHEDKMYRGSIVDLQEDTDYEVKVLGKEGEVLKQQAFETWSSTVPIAKTIVLDENSFDGSLYISEEGTPDGWIRYTAKPGFILRNQRKEPLIKLSKAKYVILEGLTLRGGLQNMIAIRKCDHVRIVNCDLAGWGRIGTQRFDLDGKYYTEAGSAINWDAAILLNRSINTVIERCYIHDPLTTANSWYSSHPAGPQAVGIDKPRSTVLRYNDFIGSDRHRWNDAVEGAGNFSTNGGFNRDADIYGNLMCFSSDDCIEIDGGQNNVRVFDNKFEGALCGVSIQGCIASPSYVFRNLIVNMGDARGVAGQTIKTSSYANGASATSFIFNNTCHGKSGDLRLVRNLRIVAKNNIFAGRAAITGRDRSPQSDCDYNLFSTGTAEDEKNGILGNPVFLSAESADFAPHASSPAVGKGIPLDNFAPAVNGKVDLGAIPLGSKELLPLRPIPVYPQQQQLNFAPDESSKNLMVVTTGEGFKANYEIKQNSAVDWFRVTPDAGTLESGAETTFSVSLVPEKMKGKKHFRGTFLIRLKNGYSRPVMVYAETNYRSPIKPSDNRNSWLHYLEAETPSSQNPYKILATENTSGGKSLELNAETSKEVLEYKFTVPESGKYFFVMRIRSPEITTQNKRFFFGIDNGELVQSSLRVSTEWSWCRAAHNRRQRLTCLQPFKLESGEHCLKIRPNGVMQIDLIAVTDNPGIFDHDSF